MEKVSERFAHVMLFACPDCARAISLAVTRDERNFEEVDRSSHALECSCGWSGGLLGAAARRHWVEIWQSRAEQAERLDSA